MSAPMRVAIAGASGRMGQMLARQILDTEGTALHAVFDRPGSDWIGREIGACLGLGELGVTVLDDPCAALDGADTLIDFTLPDPTVAHANLAAEVGCAHVIGTTGFDPSHLDAIAHAARSTPIVRAGNMSLGVNLLTLLTKTVAQALDEDFDIEIVEAHHNRKVDAPSGTALMLGEAAADGRGVVLPDVSDRGRDGITGARNRGDIGFHAIRGGDVVGEHDVVFAADGERIVLRHLATDRRIFARGAVKAALWTSGKPAGEYSMLDVLGLAPG